jgi:hypothetical protein
MGQQLSAAAMAIMADDLSRFAVADVEVALTRVRRECARFTLAAVIDRLPNGWPGAEEAWATFPKDEADSAVVTGEAMRAWSVAMPLWDGGDKIGARMAFREAYEREVSQATGAQPEWTVTIGYDVTGRAGAIQRGIDQGKLKHEDVKHLMPPERHSDHGHIVGLLTGTVSAMPTDNKIRARLGELKSMMDRTTAENEQREQKARADAVSKFDEEKRRQLEALKKFESKHVSPESEKKAREKLQKHRGDAA